jgi:hypothetical protein
MIHIIDFSKGTVSVSIARITSQKDPFVINQCAPDIDSHWAGTDRSLPLVEQSASDPKESHPTRYSSLQTLLPRRPVSLWRGVIDCVVEPSRGGGQAEQGQGRIGLSVFTLC